MRACGALFVRTRRATQFILDTLASAREILLQEFVRRFLIILFMNEVAECNVRQGQKSGECTRPNPFDPGCGIAADHRIISSTAESASLVKHLP